VLLDLKLRSGDYILATVHRAENTDDPNRLAAILGALTRIAAELPVVLPLHPRTRGVLDEAPHARMLGRGVRVIDPVGYLDMVMLEKHARLVVTDSGGVQKEAFFHGVPCVTVRHDTEWVELLELGWNRLAPPTGVANVYATIREALEAKPGPAGTPYGEGDAARRIAETLRSEHALK
jgi:UDP-GlcNAc3NAcA epimerase